MSDRWLTSDEASETIRARLNASVGRSEAVLNAARASGEVRTQEPIFLNDDGLVGMRHRQIGVQRFNEDDLLDWLDRHHPKSRKGHRGGRPPAYDWTAIKNAVIELMDENGDFSIDDPTWNAQARLEAVLNDKFGVEKSALRVRLPNVLKDWRKLKAGN
jgi:hypothetical protein